jgi:hypothetical protein
VKLLNLNHAIDLVVDGHQEKVIEMVKLSTHIAWEAIPRVH